MLYFLRLKKKTSNIGHYELRTIFKIFMQASVLPTIVRTLNILFNYRKDYYKFQVIYTHKNTYSWKENKAYPLILQISRQ